jgi:hypothetical protein
VSGIAGDEDAPDLIVFGHRDAQVPEPDMLELAGEREAGGVPDQGMEVVVVGPGVSRHRGVEEPTLADIDPAEELPVAFQRRVQRIVGGARRETLEAFMQLA